MKFFYLITLVAAFAVFAQAAPTADESAVESESAVEQAPVTAEEVKGPQEVPAEAEKEEIVVDVIAKDGQEPVVEAVLELIAENTPVAEHSTKDKIVELINKGLNKPKQILKKGISKGKQLFKKISARISAEKQAIEIVKKVVTALTGLASNLE